MPQDLAEDAGKIALGVGGCRLAAPGDVVVGADKNAARIADLADLVPLADMVLVIRARPDGDGADGQAKRLARSLGRLDPAFASDSGQQRELAPAA